MTERRIRLHVAALSDQDQVFWVTEERFAAACARHPELAARVDADWSWDFDGFERGIADAEAVIGWRFDKEVVRKRAPRLRWLQLTGAGFDHLNPLDWLPPGAFITNNSGAHGPKAGEFAGTAVLALNHALPFFATRQHASRWEKKFTTVIDGKTLLVIGLGAMGGAAARWIRQGRLGVEIVGVRRSGKPHRYVDRVVPSEGLDEVLPTADFVLVTVPLTDETRNLIGAERIARMKHGACLVNLGRGPVVDYEALADALEQGRLSGAILDVFDPEPLPSSSRLWSTPNLLIVPHCSSDDAEQYIPRTLDLWFANLQRYLAGRPMKNRVSVSRQY